VYIDAHAEDVRIIQSPVGMPGRAFDGEFIRSVAEGRERPRRCSFHCIKTCDYTKSPYCIIKALYNAARGNMKKGYAFAGGNAYLADRIRSVREVIEKLKAEMRQNRREPLPSLCVQPLN
jgi:NAD(P)H-dependent flavin oxidoreductase YrpB (nitropropane dioxygenase family)